MPRPNRAAPSSTASRSPEEKAAQAVAMRAASVALRPYRERLEVLRGHSETLRQRANTLHDSALAIHERLKKKEQAKAKRWPNGRPRNAPEEFELAAAEIAELREQKQAADERRDAASARWRPVGALVDRCEKWLEENQVRIVDEYVAQQEGANNGE